MLRRAERDIQRAYARGLEDAARVAEKSMSHDPNPDDSVFGFNAACEEIAEAIRALKPRDNELKQGVADTPAKPE